MILARLHGELAACSIFVGGLGSTVSPSHHLLVVALIGRYDSLGATTRLFVDEVLGRGHRGLLERRVVGRCSLGVRLTWRLLNHAHVLLHVLVR